MSRYSETGLQDIVDLARTLERENYDAYRQRNYLVAALSRLFPSGVRTTDIDGWDPEWRGCCYIDLPSGQISYHYHDSSAWMFMDLPPYTKDWDGHDKAIVHDRLLQPIARVYRP